ALQLGLCLGGASPGGIQRGEFGTVEDIPAPGGGVAPGAVLIGDGLGLHLDGFAPCPCFEAGALDLEGGSGEGGGGRRGVRGSRGEAVLAIGEGGEGGAPCDEAQTAARGEVVPRHGA